MYRLTSSDAVIRLTDNAFIPSDPNNKDWQEYQEWLNLGNISEPAVSLAQLVPQSVSMRQARLALLQSNLLQQVSDAVNAMTGIEGNKARIEWEFSSTVERNRPLVQNMSMILNLTSEQLDNLFVLAASL